MFISAAKKRLLLNDRKPNNRCCCYTNNEGRVIMNILVMFKRTSRSVFDFRMKTCVFLLPAIFMLLGCAREDKLWNDAKMANSDVAYVNFLKHYPESKFAEEARCRLKNYIRSLHVEAFQLLDENYENGKLKADQIYSQILLIDPQNSLALNNKAFIICRDFYSTQSTVKLYQAIELLSQALINAKHERVDGNNLAFVLKGDLICAAQPTEGISSSLRGLVINNLQHLHGILNTPFNDSFWFDSKILLKGTVIDSNKTPVSGWTLWLTEGTVDENNEAFFSMVYDRNGQNISPYAKTDSDGNFSFTVDSDDTSLDYCADKQLIILASKSGVPNIEQGMHVLYQYTHPLVFQICTDGNEMLLGELILLR